MMSSLWLSFLISDLAGVLTLFISLLRLSPAQGNEIIAVYSTLYVNGTLYLNKS